MPSAHPARSAYAKRRRSGASDTQLRHAKSPVGKACTRKRRRGLFSLAGFCTKERVVQSVKEPSVLDGFKALLRNKPLLLIVIGNVLSAISGIGGFFQAYYYSEVVEMNSLTIIISLPGTILGFITYLLIPKVKEKFDNRQIIFLNGFVRLICGIAVFLVGVKCFTNLWVVVPLLMVQNLLFSFFNTINMVIPTEMIGDTIDYMEWKTGERNEGVSFSVLTFVGKLTGSISGTIGNLLLPLIGLSFVQISATETMTVKAYDYTDTLIWGMFTLAPAVLGLLPLIPYIWYDLTGEKLRQVREEMAERRTVLSAIPWEAAKEIILWSELWCCASTLGHLICG